MKEVVTRFNFEDEDEDEDEDENEDEDDCGRHEYVFRRGV